MVIPLGFKPKTFRTGICQPILSKSLVFIGFFGFSQKRICADFAPIRLVITLVIGCKDTNKRMKNQIYLNFSEREYLRAKLKGNKNAANNAVLKC